VFSIGVYQRSSAAGPFPVFFSILLAHKCVICHNWPVLCFYLESNRFFYGGSYNGRGGASGFRAGTGDFGRALGRVLAHELYHIFANTTRHGSDGVGREYYNVEDLLAAGFQFETRELLALKNSKAHVALAHAAQTER
jgi:hypothetical protein